MEMKRLHLGTNMNETYFIENDVSDQISYSLKQDSKMYNSYSNTLSNNILPPLLENHMFHNNQDSVSVHQELSDMITWEGKMLPDIDRTFKQPDYEMPGIDLNPASYSNIELIITGQYSQSSTKGIHSLKKIDSEWFYKETSGGQISGPCNYGKFQKSQHLDFITKNYNYDIQQNIDITCRNHNRKNGSIETTDYLYNYENKFINHQSLIQNECCFGTNISTPLTRSIDLQTESSNEDSDIIVEESDEEITEYSEIPDNGFAHIKKNPLTMSSQKPVIRKLMNIVGKIPTTRNYMCSECLGLINSIDHLQTKLELLKVDLTTKFRKSGLERQGRSEMESCSRKPFNNKSPFNKYPKYKCKLCKKILCFKRYCLYHLKQHRNRGYLCDLCGKVFSNKRKFSLHTFEHKKLLNKRIESFKCANCNKTFRTKSNRKEHENYCLGTLPFKCTHQYCDKKFPSATKLKSHIKLKHDKKFTVICSICNIGFIKVSQYKNHMVSHSPEKKYSCLKCNKNYKTLSNLNFHMKIHSDSLPFSCHICNKGFMRREYLEAHINNHNGIKNFPCSSCGKKFVSQKNLDAHLKYHEGTVKKNSCNICGKTMTTGFEDHLRIHNDLKEFECIQCDIKFNTKGAFSKHVKKKHM